VYILVSNLPTTLLSFRTPPGPAQIHFANKKLTTYPITFIFQKIHSSKYSGSLFEQKQINNKATMAPMKIFDHLLADVYWNPETGIIEEVYKETTAGTCDDHLKEYSLQKINIMKTFIVDPALSLNGMLIDSNLFFYEITPELQKWTDEYVVSFFNQMGLKKLSVTISQGLFEQLAIEETATECANDYEIKFFPDKFAAKSWLLQSSV
jgi:hypothetical protein